MQFNLYPMTIEDARQVVQWKYAPPYDVYTIISDDMEGEAQYYVEPANGYYSLVQGGMLIGFACYGAEGQVPDGDYSADMLDVGIGIRPDLTGQGMGNHYAEAVFNFARVELKAIALRTTIAEFNKRSQRVVEKVGFQRMKVFAKKDSDKYYEIWIRE